LIVQYGKTKVYAMSSIYFPVSRHPKSAIDRRFSYASVTL